MVRLRIKYDSKYLNTSTFLVLLVHVPAAYELWRNCVSVVKAMNDLTHPSNVVNDQGEAWSDQCQRPSTGLALRVGKPHDLNIF